jgi:hypothetical protein
MVPVGVGGGGVSVVKIAEATPPEEYVVPGFTKVLILKDVLVADATVPVILYALGLIPVTRTVCPARN